MQKLCQNTIGSRLFISEPIPQPRQAYTLFKGTDVNVLGLHTVFEHLEVMEPSRSTDQSPDLGLLAHRGHGVRRP